MTISLDNHEVGSSAGAIVPEIAEFSIDAVFAPVWHESNVGYWSVPESYGTHAYLAACAVGANPSTGRGE